MNSWWQALTIGLREMIYPSHCLCCDASIPYYDPLFCEKCIYELSTDPHVTCPRCSSSVGRYSDTTDGCLSCRRERYGFDGVIRLGPYVEPLRSLVIWGKQRGHECVAEQLGKLWAKARRVQFETVQPDYIVPIPLHFWRQTKRGFNQCEHYADAIAQELQLPCLLDGLKRLRFTGTQKERSPSERRTAMVGAFQARPFSGWDRSTVLLVDDVLTSGSTASEAARALRVVGVRRIIVAVVAHGR